jgi:hypothetical protein
VIKTKKLSSKESYTLKVLKLNKPLKIFAMAKNAEIGVVTDNTEPGLMSEKKDEDTIVASDVEAVKLHDAAAFITARGKQGARVTHQNIHSLEEKLVKQINKLLPASAAMGLRTLDLFKMLKMEHPGPTLRISTPDSPEGGNVVHFEANTAIPESFPYSLDGDGASYETLTALLDREEDYHQMVVMLEHLLSEAVGGELAQANQVRLTTLKYFLVVFHALEQCIKEMNVL